MLLKQRKLEEKLLLSKLVIPLNLLMVYLAAFSLLLPKYTFLYFLNLTSLFGHCFVKQKL